MVTDNKKEWAKLVAKLRRMDNKQAEVGIQGGNYPKTGESVAQVAAKNEFGSGIIPERSFMRSTFDEKENKWTRQFASLVFTNVQRPLNKVGKSAEKDIVDKIYNGQFVPNAPFTIKMKGFNKPLIHTERMVHSVKSVVRKKGDK